MLLNLAQMVHKTSHLGWVILDFGFLCGQCHTGGQHTRVLIQGGFYQMNT